MCVIIHHQRKHQTIPLKELQNAIHNNPHGWGLVTFTKNGTLTIQKELPKDLENGPDAKKMWEMLDKLKSTSYILHLRNTTVGENSVENLHPFELAKDTNNRQHIALMHNGTLNGWRDDKDKDKSDTRNFVDHIAKPLAEMHVKSFPEKCIISNAALMKTIEEFRGHSSRFILISGKRSVYRFGTWTELDWGFCSNNDYFKEVKRGPHQKKTSYTQHGSHGYESYAERQARVKRANNHYFHTTHEKEEAFWKGAASGSAGRPHIRRTYPTDHTFFESDIT